jgi:hypothetical protein
MAETTFNIDSYIEDLKTAQKQAAAKKVTAEAEAKKKKSESNAAKRVRAEANNKFQYAESLEKTLIDFEGKLKVYGTKIARGDVLDSIEQRDFDYAVKQYKSISTNYTTALNEGNAILAKMPASYAEEKEDIQKDIQKYIEKYIEKDIDKDKDKDMLSKVIDNQLIESESNKLSEKLDLIYKTTLKIESHLDRSNSLNSSLIKEEKKWDVESFKNNFNFNISDLKIRTTFYCQTDLLDTFKKIVNEENIKFSESINQAIYEFITNHFKKYLEGNTNYDPQIDSDSETD